MPRTMYCIGATRGAVLETILAAAWRWMPAAPSTAAGILRFLGRVLMTSRWSSSPRTGRGCGTSRGAALMTMPP
ncbi:MAG TPA: hypothetical protein VMV49_03795 [Candidatus Deferrimicrobium sp.]|nr:hypothetical protein [Candidatus Deferrimicrobium sp.]